MKDFQVELIGHASIRLQTQGKTLLTDPWYVDPINCNTLYHWPPLVHDIKTLAKETDYIWISHIHPDHCDARTLKSFSKKIPIFIGDYRNKTFRNELRALGFSVNEVPFQTPTRIPGSEFEISLIESDYAESAAFDSSIVVKTPEFTLFNNNDCFLKDEKYHWVRRHFQIDYGFIGFSPASYYPICLEMDPVEKSRLLKSISEKKYASFVQIAELLKPKLSVPFAMGIRFLHESMLWQNVSFNLAKEAVSRLQAKDLMGAVLFPGDRILPPGRIEAYPTPWRESDETTAIQLHAGGLREWIEDLWAREEPAEKNVIDRFKQYMTDLWGDQASAFPEVRDTIIAYQIEGLCGGEFYFDFSKTGEAIFIKGKPRRCDVRYVYSDRLLQWRMDGKIDWDELHFSNRISILQNRYPAQFYALLRGQNKKDVLEGHPEE